MHVELGDAQPERHDRFRRPRWWHRRLTERGARVGEFGGLGPIGDDPVMADAHEARGQDVEQKAADEFGCIEREYFTGVAVGIVLVAESHLLVAHAHQPMVGNGDPMGVAAEVVENLLSGDMPN